MGPDRASFGFARFRKNLNEPKYNIVVLNFTYHRRLDVPLRIDDYLKNQHFDL